MPTVERAWNQLPGDRVERSIGIVDGSPTISAWFSTTTPGADSISVTAESISARVPLIGKYRLRGVRFTMGGRNHIQLADGTVVHTPNPTTGGGTPAGTVQESSGRVTLQDWVAGQAPDITNWRGLMVPPTTNVDAPFAAFQAVFRTAASPIRPGSLQILGKMQDGTSFSVAAGVDGKINGTRVKGRVDYEFGLVELFFVNPDGLASMNVDLSFLGIAGLTTIPADLAMLATVRYNAVAFSYLPLDADLLGIDPVRLPSDGRVPIFRPGGFAVVGHTGAVGPVTVSNGQTINCGRVRLSRVRVIGNNGAVINTGYTANLEAGTVTFNDVTGYSQPVTVQHRIEDMAVVSQAQINGEITFTRPLTHDYPLGSYVSSALIAGDLYARVSTIFDLASWNGTFSDTPGAAATATFNNTTYPIAVTNAGAITERWAVQFTNTTSFNVIGENVGVIATGNTSTNCAPLNPNTGVPYFTIPALGWGSGWATGNVLRFNTVGAMFPVWVVRTVQQGPETVPDDDFTILIRGDVNTD